MSSGRRRWRWEELSTMSTFPPHTSSQLALADGQTSRRGHWEGNGHGVVPEQLEEAITGRVDIQGMEQVAAASTA